MLFLKKISKGTKIIKFKLNYASIKMFSVYMMG